MRRRDYLWIALVAIVLHAPAFLRPLLDSDEAQYAAIAELVRGGEPLYAAGGVDNKPPAIYWTYAVVFELAGRYAMWAVHVLALLVVIATAWIVAAIAARLATRGAGMIAGLCYAVFTTVYYPKMLAANCEIFVALALAVATLLLLRAREAARWVAPTIAAGAAFAIACMYKQTAATYALAIVYAVVAMRGRIVAAIAGAALAGGAGMALLAATGSIDGAWHWCVAKLGTYGANAWRDVPYAIAVGLLPYVASSALVWFGAALRVRRLRGLDRPEKIVWMWFATAMAAACAGGHYFGHYFIQPLAPLVVLAGIELDRRDLRIVSAVLLSLPAGAFFVLALVMDPVIDAIGSHSPDYHDVAAWARAHTQPGDRIFVWGNFAGLYVLGDRLPATRFLGFLRGADRGDDGIEPTANWDTGPEVWPALADDFAAHPPALVIDTSTANYSDFATYPMSRFPIALGQYDRATVIDGVAIYRRR